MLPAAQLQDVAIPVAEPRRGLNGGQVVGLLQTRQQLLRAAEYDHGFFLRYDTGRATQHVVVRRHAMERDRVPDRATHVAARWTDIRAASCRTSDTRQVGVSDPARRGPNSAKRGRSRPHTLLLSSLLCGPVRRGRRSVVLTSLNAPCPDGSCEAVDVGTPATTSSEGSI